MRSMTLKTRISVALLVAFAIVAGIATTMAQSSFRETEVRHVREDSQARVDAIAQLVDARFRMLGHDSRIIANNGDHESGDKLIEKMHETGFTSAIVIAPEGDPLYSGEVRRNETIRQLLLQAVPPPDFPSTVYRFENGWLLVGSRSTDLKTVVVGGMTTHHLSDVYLVDALIHSEYEHAIVTRNGTLVASSTGYGAMMGLPISLVNESTILESFSDQDVVFAQRANLTEFDAYVSGLAPSAPISMRVKEMTARFLLSMAVAFGTGGSVTILLVAYSFRPLDRITEAAKRLGSDTDHIPLEVKKRDELGLLAEAMNAAAAAIGEARRAESARAEEARLSAEDFELTVGELSRAVGEAETPHDVAAQLADGLLRVTSARAVLVRQADAPLAAAGRGEDDSMSSLETMFNETRGAFHVVHGRSGDGDFVVAMLPYPECTFPASETRKLDILVAQASVAMHRARASVELKNAKLQKETFLDILSHDLKNPLAVARGRIELIGRKEPQLAEKMTQIEASLDRATRIIEEAVLLSKLERGSDIERAPLDLTALVEESAASLRPLAAPRHITIGVDAPPALMWPANKLLQRAVENLISNAIKWSPENSSVEIRLVPDDHVCLLLIVDHGPGIPAEDKARLFARFERADRTGVKGTGLGLAIAKRVTDMHGGTIHIEDTPGGGATFVLQLQAPAATQEVAPEVGV